MERISKAGIVPGWLAEKPVRILTLCVYQDGDFAGAQ